MIKFLITLTFLLFSHSATADYSFRLREIQQMPPFCRGLSIGNFDTNAKHLKSNVKVPGQHTQHFCHGMKSMIREQYKTAINEFEYVQHHSTKKHALIPATSLYKAEALGKLGEMLPALQEYNKAIQLKPKYSQAYIKLANFYLKLKQKKNAIETIQLGLTVIPNSKLLNRKIAKLNK